MGVPLLTVQVADRDVTAAHDSLTFSNADPGGFEVCQLDPQSLAGIRPGAPVIVRCGMEYAWHGRLNEPGQQAQGDRDTFTLAALGYGAALKDKPYQEIYVGRDVSGWGDPSTSRNVAINGVGKSFQRSLVVEPDTSGGAPGLSMLIQGTFDDTEAEAVYGNPAINLARLYIAAVTRIGLANDANLTATPRSWSNDNAGNEITGSDYKAASSIDFTPSTPQPYMVLDWTWTGAGPAGIQGSDYGFRYSSPAVYGNHGLPIRGTMPGGFYPSDIFTDALRRSGAGIAPGVIEDASGLQIAHLIYPTPTGADAIADQMANLMAWHWGVWEPATVLDTLPTAHFRSPPADATCVVSRADCIELDPPKVILDQLYDTAKVSWRDAAGSAGTVTVTLANPLLAETGVGSRTLVLDMGTGTAATAQTFGTFALLLSQRTARGGGYCVLGDTVGLPGGGRKPACLLKAGRDRLRITDLPDAGPLHETDTRRMDTFHVRRCETSIVNGQPQTRVDFDGGADLMEVLQARLAVQVPLG